MTVPPDFPWRAGMLTLRGDRLCTRVKGGRWTTDELAGRCDGDSGSCREQIETVDPSESEPDPADGATVGALAQAVREAWGDPTIYVEIGFVGPDAPASAWLRSSAGRDEPYAKESTEFAAWLAAWNARTRGQG